MEAVVDLEGAKDRLIAHIADSKTKYDRRKTRMLDMFDEFYGQLGSLEHKFQKRGLKSSSVTDLVVFHKELEKLRDQAQNISVMSQRLGSAQKAIVMEQDVKLITGESIKGDEVSVATSAYFSATGGTGDAPEICSAAEGEDDKPLTPVATVIEAKRKRKSPVRFIVRMIIFGVFMFVMTVILYFHVNGQLRLVGRRAHAQLFNALEKITEVRQPCM